MLRLPGFAETYVFGNQVQKHLCVLLPAKTSLPKFSRKTMFRKESVVWLPEMQQENGLTTIPVFLWYSLQVLPESDATLPKPLQSDSEKLFWNWAETMRSSYPNTPI